MSPRDEALSEDRPWTSVGGLILTGGGSMRMGADKAQLTWLGQRAVDRVFVVAKRLVSGPIYTVGSIDYGLPAIADDVPGAGPVGGIIKGCQVLKRHHMTAALVLAVDAPTITPADLEPLLMGRGDGCAYEHFQLPMLLPLAAVPADAVSGWPIARLIEHAKLRRLPCPPEARERVRGANTPQERATLQLALEAEPVTDSA